MTRPSYIALDGALLGAIADFLTPYVGQESSRLAETYKWKIPDNAPLSVLNITGFSLADANLQLKRSLSEAWHVAGSDRVALAKWYVRQWGGIYGNKDETLQSYIFLSEDELECAPLTGVATWSKILAMRDPDRYAIFDARVSAALNALQISEGADPILFPALISRNTTVRKFQSWIKAEHRQARHVGKDRAYQNYMSLLREVSSRLEHNSPDRTEMVLFANAEALIQRAMAPHLERKAHSTPFAEIALP